MTFMRLNTITDADFLGNKVFRLADGSTVPSATILIRSLKVGDIQTANATESVANVQGSLLLGQSPHRPRPRMSRHP
ncbi:MAG: hypothetical protein NT133_05190 [Alphaproteobacteria bacterium]|nr:hypothetical protein [Alphaproteobacteria bacterium]